MQLGTTIELRGAASTTGVNLMAGRAIGSGWAKHDILNFMSSEFSMSTLILEMPQKLLRKFGETPGFRSRAVLEEFAIECYRTRTLFNPQCSRLLKMTDLEFQQFLRERGVPSNVPVEMFIRGYWALRKFAKK